MDKIYTIFEKVIITVLLGLMMIAVLVSTVELAVILYQQLMEPPRYLLNVKEMLEVFGFFLLVLIGLELLESIKAYLQKNRVPAKVVLLVALVAVSRKIIILDYKETSPDMLYGMSAIILALSGGYYLVRRAMHWKAPAEKSSFKD
jgi:uncharacterized membrane protein (DUF373 family)